MASELYKKVLQANQEMFDRNVGMYHQRVKDAHQRYLFPFVQSFVQALKGKVVLDLGCGTGRELLYFQKLGLEAMGVDCSKEMVNHCLQKNLKVMQKDFMSLSLPPCSFDGIWSYTSLTLVPREIFLEMIIQSAQWLKPQTGIFALGMIEGIEQGWKIDRTYQMPKYNARYSSKQLEEMVGSYFDILSLERVADPAKPGKFFLHLIGRNKAFYTRLGHKL
ncbi:MAG TPA: class I SAM-dependent methyltransferase [Rhabdochlamydiaceae bacterium]|nr:class I SAM-dependent methyltransferase [Rhabdochlamydiaceae bacterium]